MLGPTLVHPTRILASEDGMDPIPWDTSLVLAHHQSQLGEKEGEPVHVPSGLAVAAARVAGPTLLQGCVTTLGPSWRFLLALCPGTSCSRSLAKECPGPSNYQPGLPRLLYSFCGAAARG